MRDLEFGHAHPELLDNGERKAKPITDEEWEELKKCRYLRKSKEEEAKEKQIDINDIFDKK